MTAVEEGRDVNAGCADRLGDLAAYVLAGLESGETTQLQNHVAACPGCCAELERLRPLVGLLALAAPAALRRGCQHRIRPPTAGRRGGAASPW